MDCCSRTRTDTH